MGRVFLLGRVCQADGATFDGPDAPRIGTAGTGRRASLG
jgi:hypothetical protein